MALPLTGETGDALKPAATGSGAAGVDLKAPVSRHYLLRSPRVKHFVRCALLKFAGST